MAQTKERSVVPAKEEPRYFRHGDLREALIAAAATRELLIAHRRRWLHTGRRLPPCRCHDRGAL